MLLMRPAHEHAARLQRLQPDADDAAHAQADDSATATAAPSHHRHAAAPSIAMNGVEIGAHASIGPPPGMRRLQAADPIGLQPTPTPHRDSQTRTRGNSSPSSSSCSTSKHADSDRHTHTQTDRASLHPPVSGSNGLSFLLGGSPSHHSSSTSNLHSSPHNGVSQLSLARSGSGSLTCVFPTPQQQLQQQPGTSSSFSDHPSISRGMSASPSSAPHAGELTPQHHHRALAGLSNIALPSPSPVSASGSSSARSVSRGALSASAVLQMQQLASASALSPPARSYPQSWSLTPPQQQADGRNGAPISAAQHAHAIAQAHAQAHTYKQHHIAASTGHLAQPPAMPHPLSAPSVTRSMESRRPPASAHEAVFSSPMSAAAPYHHSQSQTHQHRYHREPVSPSMLQPVRPPSLRSSSSGSALDEPHAAAAARPRSASMATFLPVCACPCSCQTTHILHGYEGMVCACGAPSSSVATAAAVVGSASVAATSSYSSTVRPSPSDLVRATRVLEAGHIFLMHSLPAASSSASGGGGGGGGGLAHPEVKKIVLFLFKGCLYACNYTPHVTRYSQPFMRVELLPGAAAAAVAAATATATTASGMPPVWATMGPKGPTPVANYNAAAPVTAPALPAPSPASAAPARPLRLYPAKQTGALALSKLSPSRRCCTLVAPNPAWDLAQLKEQEHAKSYAASAAAASATPAEGIASLQAGAMQVSLQPFAGSSSSAASSSLALPSMVFPSFTTGASHSFATPVAVHQSSGLQARTPRLGMDASGAPSPKTPLSPCTPGGGILATTPGGSVRRKSAGLQDRAWESPVHVLELEASSSSHLHSFVSALHVFCAGHDRNLMLLCPPMHTEIHVQAVAGRLFHGALSNRDARRRLERRERKSSAGAEDRLRVERAREKAAYTSHLESLRRAFEGIDSRVGLRLLAAMYDQGRGVREGRRRHEALRRINEERRKIEQEKTRMEGIAAAELSPQSSTRSASSSSSAPVHAASSPPSRTGPSFSASGPTPPHLFVAASDAQQDSIPTASMLSSPMQLHQADTSLANQPAPIKEHKSSGFFSNLFSRGQNAQHKQSPSQQQQSNNPLNGPTSTHPSPSHQQHQQPSHAALPSSHPAAPPPSSVRVIHQRVPSGGSGLGQDSPDLEFGSRVAAAASRHPPSASNHAAATSATAAKTDASPPLHGGSSRGSHASWMAAEHDAPPVHPSHLSLSLSDGSDHSSHPAHAAHSTMPVPSPPARAQAAAAAKSSTTTSPPSSFGPPPQPHSGTDLSASSLLASSPSPRASSLSLDSVMPSPMTAPSGFLSPEFLSPDSTRVWSYGS